MAEIIKKEPEVLWQVLSENLSDNNTYFVFSTDVVMNSWIDWCVCNPEKSGTDAVPLERFTAWDKFKSEFITSSEQGKSSIPSVLRKIFVTNLLRLNEENPFFKKIINPQYAKDGEAFASWIAKTLPSLKLWHEKAEILDDEDKDYQQLYERYSDFLEKNNLFEPSWITPDFSGKDKKFIVFYPEILEDYSDYIEIFNNCPNITLVLLPEDSAKNNPPACYKYSDSRRELRRTILQMRKLVDEKKAGWNEISLSVPDLKTYTPYLQREFNKYCIPYVIKAGNPLTANCAGKIFREIYSCYNSNFSYDSLRTLLLDEYVPWSENARLLKTQLIKAGRDTRTICSYENLQTKKTVDIWEQALNFPPASEVLLPFYRKIKNHITRICEAVTFEGIATAWIMFKNEFLEESDFSETANNIISRCITHLNELSRIENDFFEKAEIIIKNPYKFFLEFINDKTYTAQNKNGGLSVYPYRLSAAANFKYQFVIDSSQKNLEIQYKRLQFLSSQKRIALGLDKEDKIFNASAAFVRLYGKSEDKNIVQFSYGEQSFSGFAIVHNSLKLLKDENPLLELDESDFILNEEKLFLHQLPDSTEENIEFSENQKTQFIQWKKRTDDEEIKIPVENSAEMSEKIAFVLMENRNKENQDKKITISQSDMADFFPCPRKWKFARVLKLNEESYETQLMPAWQLGTIYHRILELFFISRKEEFNGILPSAEDDFSEKLMYITDFVLNKDSEIELYKYPLTLLTLNAQKEKICSVINLFLKYFCAPQEEKGFGKCKIVRTEASLTSASEDGEFNYYGKLDCVICDDEDNIYIVDFKTGKVPTIVSCKIDNEGALKNFQMPMYITLWQQDKSTNVDVDYALFSSIKDANNTFIVEQKKSKTMEDYQPTLQVFKEYSKKFVEKVKSEELEPVSNKDDFFFNVDPFTDCTKCGYKTICRTTFNIKQRTIN